MLGLPKTKPGCVLCPWHTPHSGYRLNSPGAVIPTPCPHFLPSVGVVSRNDLDILADNSTAQAQLLGVNSHLSYDYSRRQGQDRESSLFDRKWQNQKHSQEEFFEVGLTASLIKSFNQCRPARRFPILLLDQENHPSLGHAEVILFFFFLGQYFSRRGMF